VHLNWKPDTFHREFIQFEDSSYNIYGVNQNWHVHFVSFQPESRNIFHKMWQLLIHLPNLNWQVPFVSFQRRSRNPETFPLRLLISQIGLKQQGFRRQFCFIVSLIGDLTSRGSRRQGVSTLPPLNNRSVTRV
jgi:hypothetical protein